MELEQNIKPAVLPERLERPMVADFFDGMTGLVDADAFIVDEAGGCWLDRRAFVVPEVEFGKYYVKVIQLERGPAVELFTEYPKQPNYKRVNLQELVLQRSQVPGYVLDLTDLVPVLKVIASKNDLLELDDEFLTLTGHHYLLESYRKKLENPAASKNTKAGKPVPPVKPAPEY